MNSLLDTHILLWAATDPPRLPIAAIHLIQNPRNKLFFSAISIWEVSVKFALKRPDFIIDPYTLHRRLLTAGYVELPFTPAHAEAVLSLPLIHKDPADRMLLAQAIVEGITLVTADKTIALYPGPVMKL